MNVYISLYNQQTLSFNKGACMVGVASGTKIELVIKVKVNKKQSGTIHTDTCKYNLPRSLSNAYTCIQCYFQGVTVKLVKGTRVGPMRSWRSCSCQPQLMVAARVRICSWPLQSKFSVC